jgi:dTDP-4-amino-4,6-dideoxygalactose transaminase
VSGAIAVLGSEPRFDSLVPMVRPNLPSLDERLRKDMAELVESGQLTKGKHLQSLEEAAAHYLGARHAIGLSSCTTGLLFLYRGLGLSDEVIVPSFTFMATVHPLPWVGAEPVFVDVDENTWCIDPDRVEAAITDQTTGIVAVHTFGNPAAVECLQEIATSHALKLIFDSAHAFGSQYRGSAVGSFGNAEAFSLTPTKPVVGGEGGIVTTEDDDLAAYLRTAREYGNPGNYGSDFPGLNGRLAEFNALLATRSLEELEGTVSARNQVASLFRSGLADVDGIRFQEIRAEDVSTFKDLSIVIDERAFGLSRDHLASALRAENIDTRKYFDPPVHLHRSYAHSPKVVDHRLAVTERLSRRSLSLPLWPGLGEATVEKICDVIRDVQSQGRTVAEALTMRVAG